MTPSARCLAVIRHFEGFRATVYADPVGIATIGYGHKLLPTDSFPDGVTEDEAEALLMGDAMAAADAVERIVAVPLTQGQLDCLVDFCYNDGAGRLGQSTLRQTINSGRLDAVPAQLYSIDDDGTQHGWIFAGGEVEPGLVLRRQADIALWNDAPLPDGIIVDAPSE
jgi:lysozyme